eukprot:scaffold35268_cov36-Cyclotella_meneghiniana.AAC.1
MTTNNEPLLYYVATEMEHGRFGLMDDRPLSERPCETLFLRRNSIFSERESAMSRHKVFRVKLELCIPNSTPPIECLAIPYFSGLPGSI